MIFWLTGPLEYLTSGVGWFIFMEPVESTIHPTVTYTILVNQLTYRTWPEGTPLLSLLLWFSWLQKVELSGISLLVVGCECYKMLQVPYSKFEVVIPPGTPKQLEKTSAGFLK